MNHEAAIALRFIRYNFARAHQTLRITSAMEAGHSASCLDAGGNRRIAQMSRKCIITGNHWPLTSDLQWDKYPLSSETGR